MPSRTQFNSNEEYNAWFRDYNKRPYVKENKRKFKAQWRKKNGTHKDALRKKVSIALRKGLLFRKPCYCGKTLVEAHHSDYRSWKKVTWLCRIHHRQADVKEGKRRF